MPAAFTFIRFNTKMTFFVFRTDLFPGKCAYAPA